ncbi:MAG: hypothetical protein K0U68_07985 [Gammaproteobacteria bacterium]|nr:hypothetical protein [Gammaproteobacteria bacterium]
MNSFRIIIVSFLVTGLSCSVFADHGQSKKTRSAYSVQGQAVTGANSRLGEPVWDLGEGLGTVGFAFVHGYNPSGPEPLKLTSTSPPDTVLATGLDENFLQALGLSAADFDPNPVNIPFHQVPVIVNPFTGERASVGPGNQATGPVPSRSGPLHPVTLHDWLQAGGRLDVRCADDGTASIRIRLNGLVPNGVYTVWALFGDDVNADGIEDRMLPVALGGVPNVLIPDHKGNAVFARELGFCPGDDPHMKLIDVTYHSDGNVFGGTVDLFLPGFPGFAVTNTHVAFPINAEPLN